MTILLAFAFLLGMVLASFGNVLAARLPQDFWIGGRSECDACQKTLHAIELIPILSYLFLRGRCRSCKERIPLEYTIVELLGGLLFMAAFVASDFVIERGIILGTALIALLVISLIDLKTQLIPDVLTIAVAICGVLLQVLAGTFAWQGLVVAGGFLGLQWAISRGKWVGSGDVLLAAAIGIVIGGFLETVCALMISYIIGALVCSALLIMRDAKDVRFVPFGPFLALGTMIILLWGNMIVPILLPVSRFY